MPDRSGGGAGVRLRPAGRIRRPAPARAPAAARVSAAARAAGQATPFLPWLVALVALSLTVSLVYSRYLFADSYYDLYAGRYIVQHGIPHRNVVTVVAHGAPWIDQQWLAHVLYYAAWAAGGYPAVAVLSSLVLTSGFAVLMLAMRGRGVPPARAFLWTCGTVIVYLGNIPIRAQSFAYPLFALTLWLVVADSRAPRPRARTWLVLPVLVLWANTHGSVLIGAAMVALYAGYRAVLGGTLPSRGQAPGPHGPGTPRGPARLPFPLHCARPASRQAPSRVAVLRRAGPPAVLGYLALGATAAGSVLCTPYGTGVIGYYKSVNRVGPALSHYVTEWQRPNPLYLVSMGFFALLMAVVIAVAVAWRRGTRPDPVLAAIALGLLVMALTAIRNQAYFAFAGSLLAAGTLARSNAGRAPALSQAFSRLTAGILAAAALIATGLIATEPARKFESLVPVRAIDVAAVLAARHPGARILADEWSSPPTLWLHPATFGRVGYDARLEQFSVAQLRAYATFLSARRPGWQDLLRGYDIVVVNRKQHDWLGTALTRLSGWQVAYSSRDGLVLERAGRQAAS
jgi:hypothetical protein